ncbi:HD domain-containing protein [Candidatus Woesearchaeota archaeon]|nr:HD domain-containing protein [Candidatus Woesearchaeota archaeon]
MIKLPTQQQCLDYFEEYKVPENIQRHCLKVQEVAVFLAGKLKNSGVKINIELVQAAALLHDLFKMAGIKDPKPNQHHQIVFSKEELAMREKLRKEFPGQHETKIAYEIFKDRFPELALTLLHEGDLHITDRTIEEALITYVDYRIFKEQIVSLEERFAYFAEVYISKNKLWRKALDRNKIVEQNIFARLDLEPCQLKEAMEAERSIRLNEAIRRSV